MIKKCLYICILFFSVAVLTATFFNYSFNVINYLEAGNTKIRFTCTNTNEVQCVEDIINLSNNYDVEIYHKKK